LGRILQEVDNVGENIGENTTGRYLQSQFIHRESQKMETKLLGKVVYLMFSRSECCVFSAWYIQRTIGGLEVIHGSLRIGKNNPIVEYGGEDYSKMEDFLPPPLLSLMDMGDLVDMHSWVEDKSGRVYDIVTENMACVSNQYVFDFKANEYIGGVDKKTLKRRGLEYMKCPVDREHKKLVDEMERRFMKVFQSWSSQIKYFQKNLSNLTWILRKVNGGFLLCFTTDDEMPSEKFISLEPGIWFTENRCRLAVLYAYAKNTKQLDSSEKTGKLRDLLLLFTQ
jgi:hypothetical protein